MAEIFDHIETFLSNPILWGVATLIAIALSLSGKLNATASSVLMWVAWSMTSFGAYRIYVYFKLDAPIRLLATAGSLCILAIPTLLVVRWMGDRDAPTVPLPPPSNLVSPAIGLAAPHSDSKVHTHEENLPAPILVFKDSPLLTAAAQADIRQELARFRNFLMSLQVEMSEEPFSVSIDDRPKTEWRTQASTNGEFYKNLVAIPKEGLGDPKIITDRYARYVFFRLSQKGNRLLLGQFKPFDPKNPETWEWPVEQTEAMFRFMLSDHVAEYLNHSYWSDPIQASADPCLNMPQSTFNPIPFYFWEIRSAFGKEFADRVAVYAVIAAQKNPLEDKKETYMKFVTDRILIGEVGIDNDGSKQEPIRKIMNRCADRWISGGVMPNAQSAQQ